MEVLAGIVFILMYVVIVSEKIHRTVAAGLGALVMLYVGVLDMDTALHHVDFNTLGLLVGMMILVGVTSHTGLFDFVAVWAAQKAKAEPRRILIYLGLITAVFSGFLDNVTTVLLMVPVTFSITQKLHISPMPFLLTQIIASNIGGTATLIGDPPNIMIGSAAPELTFMMFIENLAPIAFFDLFVVMFIMEALYRKQLHTKPELQSEVMAMDAGKCIKDHKLLGKSLFALGLTILGFFTHSMLGLESSLIALGGGFLLLLLAGGSASLVEKTMKSVEWATIFFFIGLFIAVGGLVETGIIHDLATMAIELTGGDVTTTSLLVLWLSAIVSSVLDNIPFVATMIPLIQNMGAMGVSNLDPVWWSLALGACLGGNGTLVGASANLIVAGLAAERGVKITFLKYLWVGFPIMILTILLSTVYVYVRYLM
ncbi:ArsB/NhaD family transporter [uncultured Selenomonas sp.]|uniref:ArsB/NhaD family transporter n=1 Tax=uncultured Selenomonas sp. TaxID=159275 RepID=UPI0025CB9D8A|nr:ArsB/NhaD family transporter [uncultured Selenomonas sp.]